MASRRSLSSRISEAWCCVTVASVEEILETADEMEDNI